MVVLIGQVGAELQSFLLQVLRSVGIPAEQLSFFDSVLIVILVVIFIAETVTLMYANKRLVSLNLPYYLLHKKYGLLLCSFIKMGLIYLLLYENALRGYVVPGFFAGMIVFYAVVLYKLLATIKKKQKENNEPTRNNKGDGSI